MCRPSILTFADCYLPGYRFGGPVRTLENTVGQLGDVFQFFILTRDRDWALDTPYPDVRVGEWTEVGKARVLYLPPSKCTLTGLAEAAAAISFDLIYLNSFFSPVFTIKPLLLRRFGHLRSVPIVLAPRGELLPEPGRLKRKALKKQTWLLLARLLRLYRDVRFQVSAEAERQSVLDQGFSDVHIALDLPSALCPFDEGEKPPKKPGVLRLAFLSRISPEKNLVGALKMLRNAKGDICFDLYGPIKDQKYWTLCRTVIETLPASIQVTHKGDVPHQHVHSTLIPYHGFFFPSNGESYGHVIHEALQAGCVLVISDRSPWRGLERRGVGWDFPLDNHRLFTEALDRLVRMDDREFKQMSRKARAFGVESCNDPERLQSNRELFADLLLDRCISRSDGPAALKPQ